MRKIKLVQRKIFKKIVEILKKSKNGIPKYAGHRDDNGTASYGYYIGLLDLEKYETCPKLFFQLLEIDQKIGWTNPDHVEECVFLYKGIKIIKDENVSLKIFNFQQKKINQKKLFQNFSKKINNFNFRIGQNGWDGEIQVWQHLPILAS